MLRRILFVGLYAVSVLTVSLSGNAGAQEANIEWGEDGQRAPKRCIELEGKAKNQAIQACRACESRDAQFDLTCYDQVEVAHGCKCDIGGF
mgnify:CR=1 FL=1